MDNQEKEFLEEVDTEVDSSFRNPKNNKANKNYNIFKIYEWKHLKRRNKQKKLQKKQTIKRTWFIKRSEENKS